MGIKLTLSKKALILVALPLAFQIAFVATLSVLLREAELELQQETHSREVVALLNDFFRLILEEAGGVAGYGMTESNASLRRYKHASEKVPDLVRRLDALTATDPKHRESLEQAKALLGRVQSEFHEVRTTLDDGDPLTVRARLKALKPAGRLFKEIDILIEDERRQEERGPETRAKQRNAIIALLYIGLAGNIFLAVVLAVAFNRSTTRKLKVLMNNTERLAVGQPLNPPIDGDDEIARLDRVFNQMAGSITEAAQKERQLVENTVDVICSINLTNRLTKVSQASLKVWGYDPADLLGKNFLDLIAGEYRQATLDAVQSLRTDNGQSTFENAVITKNGTYVSSLWSAQWSHSEKSLFCVVHDITERKRTEDLLKASEARLRQIFEQLPLGIMILQSNGQIEFLNPAVELMFHVPAANVLGTNLNSLIDKLYDGEEQSEQQIVSLKGKRKLERQAGGKESEKFPVELTIDEFETKDGSRFLAVVEDVSERYEVDKLKQQFTSMVSHELRTPLTSVQGVLDLMQGDIYGKQTEQAKAQLGVADRNIARVMTLINDLLAIDRLQDGQMRMNYDEVSVQSLIDRAWEVVKVLADKKEIVVNLPTIDLKVFADGERLTQVLVNLLSNAVKFTPEKKSISIAAEHDAEWLEMRVKDEGRGVPSEFQEKVFDRFFQVKVSDTTEKGGSGLGLAICKAIVKAHSGTIGVTSDDSVGSTFWFRIPIEPLDDD